jgi:hypothetical protein
MRAATVTPAPPRPPHPAAKGTLAASHSGSGVVTCTTSLAVVERDEPADVEAGLEVEVLDVEAGSGRDIVGEDGGREDGGRRRQGLSSRT